MKTKTFTFLTSNGTAIIPKIVTLRACILSDFHQQFQLLSIFARINYIISLSRLPARTLMDIVQENAVDIPVDN